MPPLPVVAAVATAGAAVASVGLQVSAQRQARTAATQQLAAERETRDIQSRQLALQEQQAEIARQQESAAARRSRREALRSAQIARAQTVSTAAAAGVAGSSGVAGGVSALGSQVGEALGFSTASGARSGRIGELGTELSGLQRQIVMLGGAGREAAMKAQSLGAMASTFGSVANLAGSLGGFNVIRGFVSPPAPPTPNLSAGIT